MSALWSRSTIENLEINDYHVVNYLTITFNFLYAFILTTVLVSMYN